MKGIYLINENWMPKNIPKQESIELQKNSILSYIEENNILPIKLNPYQVNEYYTIPHALLYDLKKKKVHIDRLIIYSEEILEDFIESYPARWVILKSFFDEVIFASKELQDQLEGTG